MDTYILKVFSERLDYVNRCKILTDLSIDNMLNPYYSQSVAIREKVKELLPNGHETTADLLLEFLSNSNDEQLREIAAFIKVSKKSEEIGMVFNFAMSLLQHDVTPIREAIYDSGIDGIKELKDHLTDKYWKNEDVKANAKAFNFINWQILRLPTKEGIRI